MHFLMACLLALGTSLSAAAGPQDTTKAQSPSQGQSPPKV